MASLSNINGLFDVHSTGAILFSTSHGLNGQILRSNGDAAPTWVAASTVIGGPYVPIAGDVTINGYITLAAGKILTVGGNLFVTGTSTLTGALSGSTGVFSGTVTANGGTSTEWNTSYDNSITGLAVSGTTTKTLTATQQDGGTLTASWADNDSNTTWPNVGAGIRTNYTLGFKPPTSSYAGFYFETAAGAGAGYFLIRGTSDAGQIYKAEGITLVCDSSWVTIASRTTSTAGVRLMSGATSAERLVIKDNGESYFTGNLAVGMTSTPNAQLHVSANGSAVNANATGIDVAAGAGGGNVIALDAADNHNWFPYITGDNYYSANNHYFRSGTGNSPYYMTINTSGNVGIGLGSGFASQKLQVTGNTIISGSVGIGNTSPGTKLHVNGSNLFVKFENTSSTANHYTQMLLQAGSATNYIWTANQNSTNWGGPNSLNIYTQQAGAIAFFTSGNNKRMTIAAGGNVGIGTDSPSAKLTIDNGSASGGSLLKSSNSSYTAHFIANTGTGNAGIYMDAMDGDFIGSNYGFIGQNNAGYMEYTVSPSSPLPYHYFAQNVGIGTTSPSNKLTISGTGTILGINRDAPGTGLIELSTAGTARGILGANSTKSFIVYNAAGNEQMSVTSGGTIQNSLINSTVGSAVKISNNAGGGNFTYGMTIEDDSTNTGFILFTQANGSAVGSILRSNSSTVYNTSSDYRLKEDLQDFAGLDMVSKIPVYDFKWKTDESRSYGVMAHELQEVLPQAVVGDKDAKETQGVDYSKIVPLLVKSIQELEAKIKVLENK